ncbi:hypothetical protein RJ641_019704 [Dillenia turbinata]|uniref:Uncharacterized protein n=1 Tax=Dillenia turbinata TaxID=194707 RepID=A0AAN8UVV2_9MAGN
MVEEWMKGCMRKLALWQTRTLKPVMSHEELDPIMSTLGFNGLPLAGGCREYAYAGGGWWWTLAHSKSNPIPLPKKPPRLILPHPIE